ncbi:MAG: hypothetical protein DRP35_08670 [Candidatus Zixiibacteriota bacterium]|nr:MAG: hypothetical protein DRP35_08670 [candidate division Zixibacteria bacterium]
MADNIYGIGIINYYQSDFDEAINNYLRASEIYKELTGSANEELAGKCNRALAGCYNNAGLINFSQGNYNDAIENFIKSLKINEKLGNKSGVATSYNNLGLIHKDQKNYHKAIDYYTIALKTNKEINDINGMSSCFNNIGNVYEEQGLLATDSVNKYKFFDKAIEQYLKSLKLNKNLGDKVGISGCYNNIGIVQQDKKEYEVAIEYYLKALNLYKELGDKNGVSTVYGNIASLDVAIAKTPGISQQKKRLHLNNAITYGTQALKIAREINATPSENYAANSLMNAYEALDNYKQAYTYAKILIVTKDSMFSQEKTQALTEAEKKFEAEKKQLMIDKLNKENQLKNETIARKNAESKKQQILIFSFLAGFLIILVFSVFLYRLFLQKKRANVKLARQKQQIEIQNTKLQQAYEEISTQRDEITAQRDMVTQQKEFIENQKQEIEDSIRYAKNIQTAVLPSEEFLDKLLEVDKTPTGQNKHFIVFHPKDVVSGDFYWATRLNDWLILTVADCTGHGVPGAFMSMLAVSFLNEIIRKKEITDPALILNKLRSSVIDALKQTYEQRTQKDGLDISLAAINTKTKQCIWAGANNPLYLISNYELEITNEKIIKQDNSKSSQRDAFGKNSKLRIENDKIIKSESQSSELNTSNHKLQAPHYLYEIKPDKMPIGIYTRMDNFTNQEIQLQKGDILYLFSDGYADQFGGEKGKKFKYSAFQQVLFENTDKPMKQQQEILEKTLFEWMHPKGEEPYEQIDDITIIGLKI